VSRNKKKKKKTPYAATIYVAAAHEERESDLPTPAVTPLGNSHTQLTHGNALDNEFYPTIA
jgi:hypothetical protein